MWFSDKIKTPNFQITKNAQRYWNCLQFRKQKYMNKNETKKMKAQLIAKLKDSNQ